MKNTNRLSVKIIIAAQIVLYLSLLIFATANIAGVSLPSPAVAVIGILDLLTIPAFMYAYVRSIYEQDQDRADGRKAR